MRFAGLFVALVSLTTIGCGQKEPVAPKPPNVRVLTEDEAVRQDAAAYAEEFGVDVDEAVRRMRVQEQMGDAVGRLRDANRERFAGLWIEHQPQFRIVVRLKGEAPATPEFANAAKGVPLPVAFVTGAAATEDEVLAKISGSRNVFQAALPGLGGTDYDVKTGDIVLYVYATGAAAEAARNKEAQLTNTVGHPVRVEVIAAPMRDHNVRGGARTSTCTTAFVVTDTASTRGVLTAGHCFNNTQHYSGFDGTTAAMSFKSQIHDADHDVQWHTTTIMEVPEFYADLTTTARVLTGRRRRTNTAVGDVVYHRGKATGYSWGTVQSITFEPEYEGACPNTTCSAVWVSVAGANLACRDGDSGGPWFNGQTAFGVHKGGTSTGKARGQCTLAFYMSTDFISDLGVSLVFGP